MHTHAHTYTHTHAHAHAHTHRGVGMVMSIISRKYKNYPCAFIVERVRERKSESERET